MGFTEKLVVGKFSGKVMLSGIQEICLSLMRYSSLQVSKIFDSSPPQCDPVIFSHDKKM